MKYLRGQDTMALLAFLRGGYTAPDLAAFRAYLVTALPRLIPGEIATYNEMNPLAQRDMMMSRPTIEETNRIVPDVMEAWQQHMPEHPLLAHYAKARDNATSRRISDRERLMLDLLRPHLLQAYQNAVVLTRLREQVAMLTEALGALPFAIVILSATGRIRHITDVGVRWLARYFDRPPLRGCLPDPLGRYVARYLAGLPLGIETPPQPPLVVKRDGRRLIVRLMAIPGSSPLLLLEQAGMRFDAARFQHAGLSRRQAEILAYVAQGRTSAEIGQTLGTSARTVEKHIERIFTRLGVTTRAAAVARILGEIRA